MRVAGRYYRDTYNYSHTGKTMRCKCTFYKGETINRCNWCKAAMVPGEATEKDRTEAAIRTLASMKYTYHGGEEWKPPIGPRPNFSMLDRKQEVIERYDVVCSKLAAALVEADEWITSCSASTATKIDAALAEYEKLKEEKWATIRQ